MAKLRDSWLVNDPACVRPNALSMEDSTAYLITTQTEVTTSVSGSIVFQLFLSIGYLRPIQKKIGVKRAQVYQSAKRQVIMLHSMGWPRCDR